MSEEPRNPLAGIEQMEACAFRLGQLARRLLADHPDLPPVRITASATDRGFGRLLLEDLEYGRDGVDVLPWATALEIPLTSKLGRAAVGGGFESLKGERKIDGERVQVTLLRMLNQDEWEVRHVVIAPELAEAGEPA